MAADKISKTGQYRAYIGTYTGAKSKGIYLLDFDAETGELSAPTLAAETPNPSFLAAHPKGLLLYAVNEVGEFQGEKAGAASAFVVDAESGKLQLLNQQSSGGSGPCHLTIDRNGSFLLVANYGGGGAAILPIDMDGRLRVRSDYVQHTGSSAHPRRQEAPHAHCAALDPSERFALIADLGIDQIKVYDLHREQGRLTPHDPPAAQVAPGSGPRQVQFDPAGKRLYVINELSSTIAAFDFDGAAGALRQTQTISTLPEGFTGQSSTAEIEIHPSGKFLYGSNRGHDSLAVYSVDADSGKLSLVEHQGEGIREPRHFLIDPSGKWLLVGNQKGDNIAVFRIDEKTGRLSPTKAKADVPTPVCICLIPKEKSGQIQEEGAAP